jgi:hypothetical protein
LPKSTPKVILSSTSSVQSDFSSPVTNILSIHEARQKKLKMLPCLAWRYYYKLRVKRQELLIFHERSEWSERSKVKDIKSRDKKLPACMWTGVVCLSVCQFVCLSTVRIKKLNNFWRNERILMKFSGPVQLLTSNFWAGLSDHPASRVRPWLSDNDILNCTSLKSISEHSWIQLTQIYHFQAQANPDSPQIFNNFCVYFVICK